MNKFDYRASTFKARQQRKLNETIDERETRLFNSIFETISGPFEVAKRLQLPYVEFSNLVRNKDPWCEIQDWAALAGYMVRDFKPDNEYVSFKLYPAERGKFV